MQFIDVSMYSDKAPQVASELYHHLYSSPARHTIATAIRQVKAKRPADHAWYRPPGH